MSDLKGLVKEQIENENKTAPLTDKQLAEMLGVAREAITSARAELGIPDSRVRLYPALKEAIKATCEGRPDISDRRLTLTLKDKGFSVSRFLVSKVRRELSLSLEPEVDNYNRKAVRSQHSSEPFSILIGASGSLKTNIQQAKAAVLYPQHGLHTLIVGPPGVGKSELAEQMYLFGTQSGVFKPDAPFIVFNCADYADNPQLLLSQLFGHVKGSFTGAEEDKVGLVEVANGGVLFLDEIHRLPPKGQEILFHIMDKGVYRRLGEAKKQQSVSLMIIGATTESPESVLLQTFRRRVPMVIKMPSLAERPISERLDICESFFTEEAHRIGAPLLVEKDVVQGHLLYDAAGNVGQLRSDIQAACARGFLDYISGQCTEVRVTTDHIPSEVKRGLLRIRCNRELVAKLASPLRIDPSSKVSLTSKHDIYTLPEAIYQFIESRYRELQEKNLSSDQINRVLGVELQRQCLKHVKRFKEENPVFSRQDLVEVVGLELVQVVEEMLEVARQSFPDIDDHLIYFLVFHLRASLERIRRNKPIVNPQLDHIKKSYATYFRIAKDMLCQVSTRFGVEFPEDEAGFIALYLRGSAHFDDKEGRVGVIVLTHGPVAPAMVQVTDRLLGTSHLHSLTMDLDENPSKMLDEATELVRQIDEGKGVLLLVDMGSPTTFGECITNRTGIPVETVDRVDTAMVIEAARRTTLPGANLEEIAADLQASKTLGQSPITYRFDGRPRAIMTVCLTGEGNAIRLKEILRKSLGNIDVEIIPAGIMDQSKLRYQIDRIKREFALVAITGTVDPDCPEIPFMPWNTILEGKGVLQIKQLLNHTQAMPSLPDILSVDTIMRGIEVNDPTEAITELGQMLKDACAVTGDQFVPDVIRREGMGSTCLEGGVAIPHADPSFVLQSAVAVGVLKEPISWSGLPVDIVCLLAFKVSDRRAVQQLYSAIKQEEVRDRIRKAETEAQIREAIINGIKW